MELVIMNLKNGEIFVKKFNSPYFAEKFKNKVKFSKKIMIIGEYDV